MGNDDYRDALAAATSRIEALERENAALRNVQSGRPATAAELEAMRLENELLRIDMKWEARVQSAYGGVTPRASGGSPWVPAIFGLSVFVFGAIISAAKHELLALAVCAPLGLFLYALVFFSSASMRRAAQAHEKERGKVVAEIARLRGVPAEAPRLRVAPAEAASPEEVAPDAEQGERLRKDGR